MDDLLKGLIHEVRSWRGETTTKATSNSGEIIPPDYSVVDGKRVFTIGEYEAIVNINAQRRTQITWQKDGKALKTAPSAVKKPDLVGTYDDMRVIAQLIQKTLTIAKDQLDSSFIEATIYTYHDFCLFWHEHPILRILARKLIWSFEKDGETTTAFWLGAWRKANNEKVVFDDTYNVQLWHPVHFDTDLVLDWRKFMLDYEILQPFKQAYREVYLLTDAEMNTNTYSNRMAAHILRSKQLYSLARIRGWKFNPYGFEGYVEKKLLKQKIKIQYWVDHIEESFQTEQPYVATDQVRFCKLKGDIPMTLADVSPVLFSEAMRDIDLFVGVSSIGNDPYWQDNNGNPRQFDNYWNSYSFGELTEGAKTRRIALERLVPRLKIAPQCSLTDRFLVVRGSVRTYKIHLGSGNILMEPNDQYLCIVPDKKTGDDKDENIVFLPFEGDKTLSIILSKAFLLADDTTITDKTILSQIGRKSPP